jgi:flavodoxin-like protein
VKSVVIYESMFGNTHAVADAIAAGLRTGGEASVVSAAEAGKADLSGIDLLVVGGPTHVRGLPWLASRKSAMREAEASHGRLHAEPTAGGQHGLRAVLEDLPNGGDDGPEGDGDKHPAAAAFDTRRFGPAPFTGRASRAIAKRLRHHGYELAAAPASFLVDRREQLLDGEIDRALAWGKSLARRS